MNGAMPRVKICGLKDADTIAAMDGLAIHEIGFVFAPSKRQVDKFTAARLIKAVKAIKGAEGRSPLAVGVFVDLPLDQLDDIVAEAPLDVVQLHGGESPAYCEQLRVKHPGIRIWRVFSVGASASLQGNGGADPSPLAKLSPYGGLIDAVLIDAPGGGKGEPFNWTVIAQYKLAAASLGLPLYVAGGLNPGNVQELLRQHAPDGIDVSSGVESDGRKDIDKIKLFVRKVIET